MKQQCPNCRNDFNCEPGKIDHCFCNSFTIHPQKKHLTDRFNTCLCPACIAFLAQETPKERVIFSWSGGKDSSMALHRILSSEWFEVVGLLTTVNKNHGRISMHGVREELLEQQAKAIGLPLLKVYVSKGTNEEYERNMEKLLKEHQSSGVNRVVFGDIFLEDLKKYRDDNMAKVGMSAVYPLWKENTSELIDYFCKSDFKTVVCCVNDAHLNDNHVGAIINREWINTLPKTVDPCGENGEFHTFCYDGPIFQKPVPFTIGEKVFRPLQIKKEEDNNTVCKPSATTGFWFCDLIPKE